MGVGAGNVRGNGEFRPGDNTDSELGPGHAKSIYLAFGDDVEVELLLLSLIASAGESWYNVALTAEQNALLDTLGGDFEVNSSSVTRPANRNRRRSTRPALSRPGLRGSRPGLWRSRRAYWTPTRRSRPGLLGLTQGQRR